MTQHDDERPKPSHLIDIPSGTAPSTCAGRTCGAVIYWAPHPSTGRPHPVSIDTPEGRAPMATRTGIGVSHFSNCPDSSTFRLRRPKGVR